MPCPTPLFVITMIFFCLGVSMLGVILNKPACAAETPCSDGQLCPPKWECCDEGCCAPATSPPRRSPNDPLDDVFNNTWYSQWEVLFLLGTLAGILVCCLWCLVYKRPSGVYMCSFTCCIPRNRSDRDSAGSVYPPPRYSRCGSIHQAPPPYSYSCASNCGECGAGCGAACGAGCGRGPLRSMTSLAEPRRREHAAFRENIMTSHFFLTQDQNYDLELDLIDCELYCDGGCKPRLGSSPPPRQASPNTDDNYCERAAYLRHLFLTSPDTPGGCESPPQPTSPTQSRESTLRRQIDERCQRRHDLFRKTPRTRKSSLYIPLSKIPPGTRKLLTRSAPVTPSGALVPNLLNFTQRVSASRLSSRSSRLEEENDPLLADVESSRMDHKF